MAKKLMVLVIVLAMGAGAGMGTAGAMEYAPGTKFFNIGTGLNFSTPEVKTSAFTLEGDQVYAPGASFSFEWLPSGKAGLTYGLETGLYYAGYDIMGLDSSVIAIPVLFRFGWHPSFIKVQNLDVYLLGKIGLTFGSYGGDLADIAGTPWNISFGGNIGAKYFFTPMIGLFLEAGINLYRLSADIDTGYGSDNKLYTNIDNYATLGVSIKLDGKK
jgi:hypothetical protein